MRRIAVTLNALNRLKESGTPLPVDPGDRKPRATSISFSERTRRTREWRWRSRRRRWANLREVLDAQLLVVLDQITDPHNVGAIVRSAAAFGAGGIVVTGRHSPAETPILAKSASGGLEYVPLVSVTNLGRALEEIGAAGFTRVGLDSEGTARIEDAMSGERIALVLGAEGKGLRQGTRAACDIVARLDVPGAIRSLNVSNAAAVALYLARRHLGSG